MICSFVEGGVVLNQKFLIIITLLLGAISPAAEAQVLYGSLTGNVTDSTNAAVPNAKVAVLNTATGVNQTGATDDRGQYAFNNLQTGTYKITITTPAFAPFVRDGIPIDASIARRLDARLDVAQLNETISVEAANVTLQTESAEVNAVIQKEEITDLPIDGGRNFQSLYKILPGFTPPTELHSDAGNPQRAMGTNANGASYSNNNTRIDGATVSYPWLPHIVAYVPAAEAIETVSVVTNSFNAEQGMAGGAAMNVTIKSGTNKFHGAVWEYHNNSALKARNYFYCLYTCQGDPNHPAKNIQNQPGFTFGGPILRNKLFFFSSWEETARRVNASGLKTIPTEQLKRGDFSSYASANIYDPATGTPDGKGRTLFPGQIIPANRIDPAAATMAALLPTSTLPGVSNDYFASDSYRFNRYNADFKVNYNPTQRITLFARYGFSPSKIYDPPTFGKAGGDALNGGQPGNATGLIQNAAVGGTYTVTPAVLIDGNIGFTRLRISGENIDIDRNFGLDVLKIPGTNGTDRLQGGIPRFTVSGFSNFGNPNVSNPFLFRDNQYTGVLNLSWTKGTHSLRFGAEYTYYTINHFQPQTSYGPRGGFNFTGGVTSLNGGTAPNTYNGWADFLLGLPNGMGKDVQYVNPSAVRMPGYGFYARDEWHATRKLTVSYGTRYEYYPFATRDHRGGERYDPATDKVLVGGVGGVPTSTGVDVGLGQLAPRLGIAWHPTEKLVVRGGFGISIDPSSFRYLRDAYPSVISLQISGASTFAPAGSLKLGLPPVTGPDLSRGSIDLPSNVGDTIFPKNYNRGYIKSFNFTLQRELLWGFVAQAGYVGTRAIRQTAIVNLNAADSVNTGQAGRLLNIQWGRTADIKQMMPFKDATYNSLQTRLTRRLKGGSFGLSYTFSKAINYADNSDSGLGWNGPSYWERNRGLAGFNRPSNLQIYFVQQLPFGKGEKFLTARRLAPIVSGWQLNGILSVMQGTPFTVSTASTSLNSVGNAQTADQVKETVDIYGGIGRGVSYFDPDAFIPVTAARFGNSGRNIIFGPGVTNLDGSLFRTFRIKERIAMQFRWEVFNVTNTPAFANPGASASSATRNADGTVKSTGGFTEITSASATERRMRFALKVTF